MRITCCPEPRSPADSLMDVEARGLTKAVSDPGRACRKVCERGEKRVDWLGLQAGLPLYGRRERQPRPAHPTAIFKLCDRPVWCAMMCS